MGGVISVGTFVMVVGTVLILWFQVPFPFILGWVFLGIVVVMGYEMSASCCVQVNSAAICVRARNVWTGYRAADIALWEWNIVQDVFWLAKDAARALYREARNEWR